MTTHDVRPPDLEMRVRTQSESGRTRLIYTLHSPNGKVPFSHQEIAGPALSGTPEELQRRLLHKIEQLGLRQDVDGSSLLRTELERKLKNLGWDLWRELFPAEIRHAYREIRRHVRSWMIVSDEPWIPWELIRPYDDSRPEEILDDDFLALRFELTRWLSGDKTPAQHIAVRSLAVFRTADLPHSEPEKEVLTEIVRAHPALRDATPRAGSADRLLSFLETGDAGLLHFIGHGLHDVAQADESGIPFPDRSVLRPADLEGPPATRVGRLRPLVFQNSCWAGQAGWSFTLLGGWAARWVRVCGCGAFVAPLWPSRDKTAFTFARTFYTALERGATLGQAALAARRQVAQERPGDPSALSYTVYGHPNARMWFGEIPPEISSPPEFSFPEPLPFLEPEGPPPRMFGFRRVGIAAAAAIAVFLGSIAGAIPELWKPERSSGGSFSPVEKAGVVVHPKELVVEADRGAQPKGSQEAPPAGSIPAAEKPLPKGIDFRIFGGGRSEVKYALKQALEKSAKPLVESGISGWTLTLKLDRLELMAHREAGVLLVACQLTAEVSADGPSPSINLGPVSGIDSQATDSQACEAATGPLAKNALTRFVDTLALEKGL
ncbi:MAG TPA: CHAT domain-containing protein [Thermoanaerobaculia bacterium]|nr:CHAT domain-containing protein [Thermoanaerobaculia bacterium]